MMTEEEWENWKWEPTKMVIKIPATEKEITKEQWFEYFDNAPIQFINNKDYE